MVAPATGAVVLVRFPFSDLSRTKLRGGLFCGGEWHVRRTPDRPPEPVGIPDSVIPHYRPTSATTIAASVVTWTPTNQTNWRVNF